MTSKQFVHKYNNNVNCMNILTGPAAGWYIVEATHHITGKFPIGCGRTTQKAYDSAAKYTEMSLEENLKSSKKYGDLFSFQDDREIQMDLLETILDDIYDQHPKLRKIPERLWGQLADCIVKSDFHLMRLNYGKAFTAALRDFAVYHEFYEVAVLLNSVLIPRKRKKDWGVLGGLL